MRVEGLGRCCKVRTFGSDATFVMNSALGIDVRELRSSDRNRRRCGERRTFACFRGSFVGQSELFFASLISLDFLGLDKDRLDWPCRCALGGHRAMVAG